MKVTPNLTRRQFLKDSGKAAATLAAASTFAPTILAARSPIETIGVGSIGLGTRGGDLIKAAAPLAGVKIVAVCDVYGPHRQKGVDCSQNPDVKAHVDYRELLADKDVDAVIIATPDHRHCQIVCDAAKTRKDIYCERGFARTLPEAKLMRAALKQSRVVFQLGHQARQSTAALQAKELIAQDILGHGIPDTWVATYQFEKLGRTVTFTGSMNTNAGQPVEICGKEATLRFDGIAHDVSSFAIKRENHNKRTDLPQAYERNKTPGQPNHMMDFFNCVRSRGTPKCPVDEAFIETATYLMSVESYKQHRPVRWDAVKEEIV